MKTTFSNILSAIVLAASFLCITAQADDRDDAVDLVRKVYKFDRQTFIARNMTLTEKESADFGPLYQSYRAEMDKLGDALVKLVLEYKDLYPGISDKDAARLLKQYLVLEKEHGEKQAQYFKRAAKFLPAAKVLRWAQLENRMDLQLRLQLAGAIPMVPGN
jgi:hypothetical protein